MSGRKVADRPDPEWVATLRKGDRVAVAIDGRPVGHFPVLAVGPKYIHVGNGAGHFGRNGWEKALRFRSRYLVPVASSPDKEGA